MLFLLLIARASARCTAENSRNSMNSKVLGAARPISTRGHALALSRLQIEHRIDIARAMQHAHDIDPVVEWQLENNVAPYRKTAHTGRQFLAGTTHHRLRR